MGVVLQFKQKPQPRYEIVFRPLSPDEKHQCDLQCARQATKEATFGPITIRCCNSAFCQLAAKTAIEEYYWNTVQTAIDQAIYPP